MLADDATQQGRDDSLTRQIAQVVIDDRGGRDSAKRVSGHICQQTPDQACQKHTGVRFENIKTGEGCSITIVSTEGGVHGKDLNFGARTSFHSGHMSGKSMPRAHSTE